jgi:hypothetical protein
LGTGPIAPAPAPPLDLLRRTDKLSLGGGRLCLWAPEYPRWADRLGFWDHAAFLEHAVEPLFTLALLDDAGRPVTLSLAARGWSPGRLSQLYRGLGGAADPAAFPAPTPAAEANLRVQEDKALSPEDVFLLGLQVTNLLARPQRLTVVLWTAQPRGTPEAGDELTVDAPPRGGPGPFTFTRRLPGGGVRASHTVAFALGAGRAPASFAANHSEWSLGRANHPRWELTPFFENARVADGHVHLPNLARLAGGPRGDTANTLLFLAWAFPLTLAEGERQALTFGCALAPTEAEAAENFTRAVAGTAEAAPAAASATAPLDRAERAWADFFDRLPRFRCSDPYLEKYYYYRFFGLRLNAVDTGGRFNLPRPCIFEGVNTGWFRHQISYSAQVHMREARWLHDPALAQGSLENFALNQRPDGSFPGGLLTGPGASLSAGFMYHGDWGAGLRALHAVHPDDEFLARVYPALVRYAAYYRAEHDRERSGLYDVRNQAETGQEYMARYQFADPRADLWGPLEPRLKGVDVTVYAYSLFRALEWAAARLGQRLPADLDGEAERIAQAVRARLWDPATGFFYDLNALTGARSPSRAAVGFYPFLTDLPGPEHLRAFDHLLDPAVFGTPVPLPATALDDPSFSAEGEWKDRRTNCPWNGRAWLMTTSHALHALAHTAQRFPAEARLAPAAADLLRRWVRALYLDGDLARPTSYEYYNPLTGAAPFFRGTDDYMHSWIADLLIQFVAGLQPEDGRLVVQPLPFDLDTFRLEDARVQGRRVDVDWQRGQGLVVRVDGHEAARRDDLGRLEITL